MSTTKISKSTVYDIAAKLARKINILNEQHSVDEASYAGNIGAMEMIKFFKVASKKEVALFKEYVNCGESKKAWELIQHVTQVKLKGDEFSESATAGATSAGNIASISNPHISPGPNRKKKSYTGYPGKQGKTSPSQPKVVQPKNSDGTAKGAHELKTSLFGREIVKR